MTSSGPPNTLPFGEKWLRAYFAEVDRMQPKSLLDWYHDQSTFRFANKKPAVGKPEILILLQSFYQSIAGIQHIATGIWVNQVDQSGVFEADVVFTRHDGSSVSVPAVSVARLKEGRVSDFRFVMDATPLFSAGSHNE